MQSQSLYKNQFNKLIFFIIIFCFSVFSTNSRAQSTVENINLPHNTEAAMVYDILYANGYIYTYTPNGINVYNASNNAFEVNFPFGEKYGKFNPVYFNSRMHVPDQNLMVFNNEASNPYLYIMMPDMNIMVINTSNFQQIPWQTPLVVAVGNQEKSLHSLFLTQNGRCMMKYDNLNDRLYILAGGRDRTYNTSCYGYFHVRTNVMSIFELDYIKEPDQTGHFNRVYSETNGEGVGAYSEQVNNFTFNAATDEFILARMGENPINADSYSVIDKYEITTSGIEHTDSLEWVVPGSTSYHKIGKLLNINDNNPNLSRIAIFPYKFPSSLVPFPEFLLLNWDMTLIETIPCPTDKVIDAVYLEGKDELLLSYSPDDISMDNLARYQYNAPPAPTFSLLETKDEDQSPVSSNFDYNSSFEFVKLDPSTTLLGKKDGIAKLHYNAAGTLLYNTPLYTEGNIFRKGVSINSNKAFIINGASNGIQVYNPTGFQEIRASYPIYHITANADGSKLYCFNKLNTYKNGLFVVEPGFPANVFHILPGLDAAIGDCLYNPYQNHILISSCRAGQAKLVVLDADNPMTIVPDIDLGTYLIGASFAKEMYISPDGKLHICVNMKYGDNPAILIFDANDYTQAPTIEYPLFNPTGTYYGLSFLTASFDYDAQNELTYALITIVDSTLSPYGLDNNRMYNYEMNPSLPSLLVSINGNTSDDKPFSNFYSKLIIPDNDVPGEPSQYENKLYAIGDRFMTYDYQDTASMAEPFIDIIYSDKHDQLFAIRDVAGAASCSHWRKCEVYKISQGSSSMSFDLIPSLSIDGQVSAFFFNEYDGRIYIHQKTDEQKLGETEMCLRSFDPSESNPEWVITYLGLSNYFPDYDNTSDPSRLYYYNITTPYIDQYNNNIYLPNGGHSCVSRVPFDANERVLLNEEDNQSWRWLSFPRLDRQNNAAVDVDDVLGENHLYPNNYINGSKLTYYLYNDNPQANSYYEPFNKYTNSFWNGFEGDLFDVKSTLGYKLDLKFSQPGPDQAYLFMEGTVFNASLSNDLPTLRTRPNTNLEYFDNWVGYYIYEDQNPFDAISANDLDHIYAMRGQYWACAKFWGEGSSQLYWVCACAKGHSQRIKYGDMVILKTYQEIENFQWQQANQTDLTNVDRPPTQYFAFTEQSDYIPIFIEMDSAINPLEIGAFVEDSCVGATTVFPNDSIVLIQAYTEGMNGEIYFESHYSNKSMELPLKDYLIASNVHKERIKKRIHTAEKVDYYLVSFKDVQKQGSTTLENQAYLQSYPNPISSDGKIVFYTPSKEMIELSLYNIMGEKQETLYSGITNEGRHEIAFSVENINGGDLKNGTYILMLYSKNWQTQAKIVVLR